MFAMPARQSHVALLLGLLTGALGTASAQAPIRLTDADLPLLRQYLTIDAAAVERATRRSDNGNATFDREMRRFESDRERLRAQIRAGELDQLALLKASSTGLLVPETVTYDAACSRQHFVNPGLAVFKGTPTGGGDAAKARIATWTRWYEARGFGSAAAYTPGTTLLSPANREKGPREVNITLELRDNECDDGEPRIHVNGWHDESDRQAAVQRRFDEQLAAADSIGTLPTAEETLAARGIDPAAYVARREALTSAYLTRTFSEEEWKFSADGASAEVRAELAARKANVAWLLGPGKELLPLLRRYLGS